MATRYAGIRAFVWLDLNDRGTHWPIETSPDVAAEFRRGIARRASTCPNLYANLDTQPDSAPERARG